MKFLSIPLLLSTLSFYQGWCQPDRVWEVQQSPETANYNSLVQYPNSKPLKIRLVNYEQRHLASRHRDGSNSRGYLESVRQRARGTLTRPVQSAVPIAQVETKPLIDPKEDRLPSLDSLHQARSLFENNRSDGPPLAPLSEFELKSDYQLQKSMQRTTVSTKTYPTQSPIDADTNSQPTTTTAIPPTTTAQYVPETVTPAAFTVTPPYPSFLAPNLTQQQGFNPLGFGFPPHPPPVPLPPTQSSTPNPGAQFEQLGCGFDLLTNTCKDVFAIGWCNACEDFGNVFLHDCKCTNPNKDRNATTQASTTTIDPVLAAAIAANNQQFLLQQQQQQQQVNFLQQQQQNLLQQQQQQIQQQQQQIQQSQQNASTLGTVPAFFVQPTFFGY